MQDNKTSNIEVIVDDDGMRVNRGDGWMDVPPCWVTDGADQYCEVAANGIHCDHSTTRKTTKRKAKP